MPSKVDVFMPMFGGDYLKDTTDLSTEEHGAYWLLLLNAWNRGGRLPNDQEKLARMAGLLHEPARWKRVWSTIRRFWTVDGDEIFQGRQVRELARAVEQQEAASERARKANEARWGQRKEVREDIPEESTGTPQGMPAQSSPPPPPQLPPTATAPPPAHTQPRARARDEDQDQGLDAKAVETRKAALAIADDWRPLRRKVDPADPITADDDAWSLAREEQAGHVVRLLQAGHTADLIRQTLTWAMHDGGDGGRWKGWRYQIATLADLGLHFAKIRKAIVAAQASAESAGPNGRKVRLYDPSKGSWEVPPAEANRLEREREQAARDRAAARSSKLEQWRRFLRLGDDVPAAEVMRQAKAAAEAGNGPLERGGEPTRLGEALKEAIR